MATRIGGRTGYSLTNNRGEEENGRRRKSMWGWNSLLGGWARGGGLRVVQFSDWDGEGGGKQPERAGGRCGRGDGGRGSKEREQEREQEGGKRAGRDGRTRVTQAQEYSHWRARAIR